VKFVLVNGRTPYPQTFCMLRCHSACNTDPVCTENLIRVDDVMESPKLAE
jgi:hypothetical protein